MAMSWIAFAGVFGAFLITHSVPVRPKIKARLVGILGKSGFTIAYSILSVFMLAWLITAAADAPYLPVWDQERWQRFVTFGGMFGVCLILAFAVGRPNPFSFGGFRNENLVVTRPGIIRWSRHPFLLVFALWSALHLLPNGDLAHIILFGAFFQLFGVGDENHRPQEKAFARHSRMAGVEKKGSCSA